MGGAIYGEIFVKYCNHVWPCEVLIAMAEPLYAVLRSAQDLLQYNLYNMYISLCLSWVISDNTMAFKNVDIVCRDM